MSTSDWSVVERILATVIDLPEAERSARIAQMCGNNPDLRAEVESLLAAHEKAESFMEAGAQCQVPATISSLKGTRIGVYELLDVVGHGGMGQVWLAEQKGPVKRQVALKLIRGGLFDSSLLERFQSERQSLAIMDHPSIAKVFDAGATADGQPYFVMEYVHGVPITDYCDQKKFTIPERLELFIKVCEGVQHAHQKAIIHRDLKPANILVVEVDGKALPRIIDFGLAKRATPEMFGAAQLTIEGTFLGTPGYVSPEQADPGVHDAALAAGKRRYENGCLFTGCHSLRFA